MLPVVFGTSLYYSRLILISFIFSCFREPLSDAAAALHTTDKYSTTTDCCVGVSGKVHYTRR